MQKLDLTKLNLSLNPGLVNLSLNRWLKLLAKIKILNLDLVIEV